MKIELPAYVTAMSFDSLPGDMTRGTPVLTVNLVSREGSCSSSNTPLGLYPRRAPRRPNLHPANATTDYFIWLAAQG